MKLNKQADIRHVSIIITESKPFVKNTRAVLIHRPKYAALYDLLMSGPHMAIGLMCGAAFTSRTKLSPKLSFVDTLSSDDVVCARCEAKAIEAGQPTSTEILNRHVCIGGVKAVKYCCKANQ